LINKFLIIRKSNFVFILTIVSSIFFLQTSAVFAQQEPNEASSLELNGDVIEYSVDGNIVTATGNVIIKNKDVILECDKLEFFRDEQLAYAEGNVRLINKQGEISGEELTFDFGTMKGELKNAKIYTHPYYGAGKKIIRVDENTIVMEDGYITTSDYDKPEWRMTSKRFEIYPGNKVVARKLKMKVGNTPIMFIPKFTQRIDDTKPRFIFTPGYNKEWGGFLLTDWRFYLNEDVKGTVHLDYREKLDVAEGIDVEYNTGSYGSGLVRLYYTNERRISANRFYQKREEPTIERERFRAEWRHKWEIDKKTTAILQYYKLSDNTFLKDFFEREKDEDSSPNTFFLLTKSTKSGTFSFQTRARVNRFESKVERLPEIQYNMP